MNNILKRQKIENEHIGSLLDFVAHPITHIKQHKYKATIIFKSRGASENLREKVLEIPDAFKASLVCQSIIAYCYTENFLVNGSSHQNSIFNVFKLFFDFLTYHDEVHELWSVNGMSSDLPHTIAHQFATYLSETKGKSAGTAKISRTFILNALTWASSLDINSAQVKYNFEHGEQLKPYVSTRNNPVIRVDNAKRKPALSELYNIDHVTGEKIECPYSDSQIISNLRWFVGWYLDLMRERREFLRQIMRDNQHTIYQIITERLNSGVWSIDKSPVNTMWAKGVDFKATMSRKDFLEASAMYAKVYEALLPTDSELEQLLHGTAVKTLTNRIIWLESMTCGKAPKLSIWGDLESTQFTISDVTSAIRKKYRFVIKGDTEIGIHLTPQKNQSVYSIKQPSFSLADMLIPTDSEMLMMQWLLASDCIQSSNQERLKLTDLQRFANRKLLKTHQGSVTNNDRVDKICIRHHKERAKGGNIKSSGRDHVTESYYKGDLLFEVYQNWHKDISNIQVYLPSRRGMWLPTIKEHTFMTSLFPVSLLCFKHSMTRKVFEQHEVELRSRSKLNGQGAFSWLMTSFIKHHQAYLNYKCKSKNCSIHFVPRVKISNDAIRESRIIFDESDKKTKSEIAKHSGHGEAMVSYYRDRSTAKERIQNGLKSNSQISDLMIQEAVSVLNSCNIMSIEEVAKTLHDPNGFTVSDVETFITEIANDPEHYNLTLFGGISTKQEANAITKIIKDEKSAWMLWCYIQHLENEITSIEANHDNQVVKWIVEHAQWQILFERFPQTMQEQAKALAEQYAISYPPLY